MRTMISLAMLLILFNGCSDDGFPNSITDGTYVGIFTIKLEDGQTKTGGVTFTFNGNSYSCNPEKLYLPPSGEGSFHVIGQVLRLKDTALHTAEFDWTLILNGDTALTCE